MRLTLLDYTDVATSCHVTMLEAVPYLSINYTHTHTHTHIYIYIMYPSILSSWILTDEFLSIIITQIMRQPLDFLQNNALLELCNIQFLVIYH